ncbi:MAG: hypothetical protein ACI9W2_001622, partial [Gammaproteobacteria bacterium]
LESSGHKPQYYLYRPDGAPPPVPGNDTRTVDIHDARALESLSVDTVGVELVHQQTAVSDFYDDEEVQRVYFPEIEALVREHLGARRVHVFDHNVRCRTRGAERGVDQPVTFVHNDYTHRSGPQRVRDLLGEDAPRLLERRYAVINVWRPIRRPVEESPLAVCDARTMRADDFIQTDLLYRDRTGEIYSVHYSSEHRWLYFPAMEPEEVMLLKCYDSARDGKARFTAHSAFADPSSPAGAAPRESVEVRTLVFF